MQYIEERKITILYTVQPISTQFHITV